MTRRLGSGDAGPTPGRVPALTGEQFAHAVAAELGLEPLTEEEIGTLLKVASVAAHSSERLAAPLCTYLAGRAGIEEVRAAVERVGGVSAG